MLSSMFDITFRVRAETLPGEVVCVVGDCPQLGRWRPEHCKVLKLERTDGDMEIWTRSLRLPPTDFKYRYFIGYVRDADHEGEERDIMVRRWETNREPRTFSIQSYCMKPEADSSDAVFGHYNGKCNIDKGWLTGQTEIHLRLHSNPIRMWKQKYRAQKYRVACHSIDLRYRDVMMELDEEESNHDLTMASGPNKVLYSSLDGTDPFPKEQPQFGTVMDEGGYLVFRAQTFEQEHLGFQFDFYVDSGNSTDIPQHVGVAFLLPVNLQGTSGLKNVPINGLRNRPVGQLAVDYLIIKPLKAHHCDMSVSYAKHWNRKRRAVDVGHRGMGSSYTSKCAVVRENTIASLSEAGGHGADFVEFDVQLSQDDKVVVYHDFLACLSLKKKGSPDLEYFTMPIQDLTFDQLQMLRLDHVSEKEKGGSPNPHVEEDTGPSDHQPFPLLSHALESIDPHVGFNIEIKYCMQLKTGELEEGLKHYMERNRYLDLILETVMAYQGGRRIIFSSFDPDICTMVRMKQNRYPIGFLSQGNSVRYPYFRDVRTQSTPMSSSFAASEGLLAVNAHSEDLIKDLSLVQQARDMGLVVMCWGEECNDKANIKRLKDAGVDGVIYDRIYELKDSKTNVFKMEHEQKVTLLEDIGLLPSNGLANNSGSYSSSPEAANPGSSPNGSNTVGPFSHLSVKD